MNIENKEIEIHNFENKNVRIVGTYENPWFAVKDICNILELSNVTVSLHNIPEKWKKIKKVLTQSGEQEMLVVNEAGLYKLIMRSNKPIAEKFQEWVCEEVLPSIRKKGDYVLQEYKKKLEEQKSLLEEKDIRLKKLQKEKQIVDGKNVVYLITSEEMEKEGEYCVGLSIDLKKRRDGYDRGSKADYKVIKYISCKSIQLMKAVETMILSKMNKYKIALNHDRFRLPRGKDVSFFVKFYDYLANYCEDIEDNIVLEERSEEEQQLISDEIKEEEKEDKSEYNKKYREEHHDEILDREKFFRENNSEFLKKRNKDYREENPEKEKVRKEKYANEHQEERKEYMTKYREEKASEIAIARKKYNLEHKEENEKRCECSCGSIVSRQNLTTHLETDIHKKFLETGETVNEQRKEEAVVCDCGLTVSKRGLNRHKKSKLHLQFEKDGIKIKN